MPPAQAHGVRAWQVLTRSSWAFRALLLSACPTLQKLGGMWEDRAVRSLMAVGWRWLAQIPAHRLLFCSTLEGKTSIVRQLEPDLHVDGHPHTVRARSALKPETLHPNPSCLHAAVQGMMPLSRMGISV